MAEATVEKKSTGASKGKFLVGLVVLAGLLVAAFMLPVKEYTLAALDWIDGLGFVGYAVFVFTYALVTVLFLPGFILTVGAGAVFGIVWGFVVVSLGSTIGASLAFLLGRFLARDMVESKVAGNERFGAIDRAVGARGWKIVFLTRLSPVFPFNLINYAYGLTKVPFWHYVLASWIGMMPGTLVYVYLGAIAGDAAAAAAGAESAGPAEWALRIIGLVATIAVTVYITRIARKALNEAVPEEELEEGSAAQATSQT